MHIRVVCSIVCRVGLTHVTSVAVVYTSTWHVVSIYYCFIYPDDVSHCLILSPDKTEWRLISAILCGWGRCFVADQLWLMTRIREEEDYFMEYSVQYEQNGCSILKFHWRKMWAHDFQWVRSVEYLLRNYVWIMGCQISNYTTNATLGCVLSYILCAVTFLCKGTHISAAVTLIGMKFCMMVHIGPTRLLPFWGSPKSKILTL